MNDLIKAHENEILRQQLELLAERSKNCDDHYLSEITGQMVQLVKMINFPEYVQAAQIASRRCSPK